MAKKRTIDEYYREEIAYLKQRGADFARAYPNLMPYFQEKHSGLQDPHVERILEGTAFLSAKLEASLDETQSHLAMELLKLFWPQILSPVPSMCMTAFKLRPTTSSPQMLEKGKMLETSRISSKSTGAQQVKYRVQTSQVINPLEIYNVQRDRDDESWKIRIKFRTTGGADFKKLDFTKPMRLHVHDPDEYAMFEAFDDVKFRTGLGSKPCEIRVRTESGTEKAGKAFLSFPDPIAMDPVLPVPAEIFPGYRILQEFMLMPNYFLCFDVHGLEILNELDGEEFELLIPLLDHETPQFDWTSESILMHYLPVINLFEELCQSRTTNLERRRFMLQIEQLSQSVDSATIHSVKDVILKLPDEQMEWTLEPFNLFRHDPTALKGTEVSPCYSLEYETVSSENLSRDVFLMLRNLEPRDPGQFYSLHARALWSDTDVNEYLREMRINAGAPETMTCYNTIQPTPYYPPLDPSRWRWVLVELMALNYQSIDTLEGLKRLLTILMPPNRASVKVYRDSILSLNLETKRFFEKRLPVNGQEFTIRVKDSDFRGCRGKMLAFYDVLHSFLSGYISINSKVSIKVVCAEAEDLELAYWEPNAGNRRIL